jgi:hypothetical protein
MACVCGDERDDHVETPMTVPLPMKGIPLYPLPPVSNLQTSQKAPLVQQLCRCGCAQYDEDR